MTRLLPISVVFMLASLCMAFFAVVRRNFESKASLLASEHSRDTALWGANAGTWMLDFKKRRIHCSPQCMEMLGYPEKETELDLKDWTALIHPDDLDSILSKMKANEEGKAPFFESEHRMRMRNGEWIWILARGRISARDPNGNALEAAGTHLDIRGIKTAKEELLRSKLRLESAQRTAKLGTLDLDITTGEVTWNEQTSLLFGLPPDTKPSRELIISIISPEDQAVMNSLRDKCIETGEPILGYIMRINKRGGELRYLRGDGHLLRDVEGKPIRIEGVVCDMTEFILAEKAIHKSEKEFRSLLENLEDIVSRISPDMKICYISPSVRKLIDIDPAGIIGKTFAEAGFDKQAAEFWNACVKSVLKSGSPMEREFSYETTKGKKLFNWRMFPEFGADGKLASVLSITRDLTKRREAESAFHDIFSNMLEGFAMCETDSGSPTDFKIISVNPAFERLTGIGAAQILNHKLSEAITGGKENWQELFAAIIENGEPCHFEDSITGVDKLFEISAYKAAENKMAFILTDVTEKKKAIQELHRQMRLMKDILDGIPDMIILMRPDRSILACNRAAKACMGWEDDDMGSCKCHSLLGLSKECEDCACNSAAQLCIQTIRNFDSSETGRSYEVRAIPIQSVADDGHVELIVELIRDTTEKQSLARDLDRIIDSLQAEILQRMNAEEALRRSEKLHRMITEAAQVGIWQLDPDGHIKYLNPRMRELLEILPDEPIESKTCFEFIPENQIKPVDAAKDRQESFIHSYESEVLGANGTKRNVLVSGIVIYVPGTKRLDAYIETFTDITQIRKAERETELRKLKLMQTEKMASLGILVSGVAHEINNPTNFIMLNAPILHDVWKDAVDALDKHAERNPAFTLAGLPYQEMKSLVPELFRSVSDGADRIKNIVAGLKDYARQEISDPFATTHVNDAVQAALVLLANMIKKSTNRFKVTYGKNIPEVKGAKQKIEQVVINLVQNSCQALKNMDCALEIKTLCEGGKVKIVVIDEGCGIPKENMPFISDPFFTTKRDSGGTGLGLSITAGIINELGGEIIFDSETGVGTTATVILPQVEDTKRPEPRS